MKKCSQEECISRLENCIRETSEWMTNNFLKLNDEKTKITLLGTQQQLANISNITIKVGTSEIKSVKSVRNLGYFINCFMKNGYHINGMCAQLYGTLRKFTKPDPI